MRYLIKGSASILFLVIIAGIGLQEDSRLFRQLEPSQTNIHFVNKITETNERSVFVYENFYNGAGVAVGDINNDGLEDIYFTGNQVQDKLYLNRGGLVFEDITKTAGIQGRGGWSSGVTMVDINGDGFLDIYVSKSLLEEEDLRANEFYINNGNLTFTESAAALGLASRQRTQQAVFFDFDRDNDLDVFLVNQPPNPGNFSPMNEVLWLDTAYSSRLYVNKNGVFEDISESAGVLHPGYGLSANSADLNNDGWPDLYVANDYVDPDFMYINNGDGTFSNKIDESLKHISLSSMGSDVADINNDGWSDIIVLDMLAEDHVRRKTNKGGLDKNTFRHTVQKGGHHQYMINTLQLHRGVDASGRMHFSEMARLAGIEATDWSWSPLFADFDNDGLKDLFITNGLKRDYRNEDVGPLIAAYRKEKVAAFKSSNPDKKGYIWDVFNLKEMLGLFPSEKLPNYMYKNLNGYQFENKGEEWGLNAGTFSNGAAYADLDNDGDLDLVVNNIDDPAHIFENRAVEQSGYHYLTIKLKSDKPVWGAKVKIVYGRGEQYYEVLNSRGYKSSGSTLVHFGLNETNRIDSLCVFWPDGTRTAIENVLADRQMVIEQSHTGNNTNQAVQVSAPYRLFKEVTGQRGLLYRHAEKAFDDFKYGPLLPHKLSGLGPFISQGDVNGDGMNDIFVGGEAFKSGVFFVREEKGSFKQQDLNLDATNEDMGSLLFDADGDGDQDLYVVSGSNEFKARSAYTDRLYVNDGRGNYSRAFDALPQAFESGSVVEGIDFDRDGDTDLFVGGRQKPFRYPSPASSFLLRNDSKEKDKPKFTDVTKEMAPELPDIGMVTDAIWADYDNDQDDDLIITGEWMGIYVFENDKGKFRNVTKDIIPPQLEGWYNCIVAADFDQDGDLDLVAGNRGGNYQNEVSVRNPLELFYGDFDLNGREDVVCSYSRDGVRYPLHDRDISALQIPSLTTRFPTYQSFATASFEEIYGKESLMTSIYLKAHNFQSIYLENRGKDHGFITHPLPIEAQFSAINDIVIIDVDNDGMKDMIIAGNNYDVEVRVPGNDAGIGLVLINKGNNEFAALDAMGSGLFLNENVRDLEIMAVGEEKWLVAMVNNGMMRVFKLGHFGSVH